MAIFGPAADPGMSIRRADGDEVGGTGENRCAVDAALGQAAGEFGFEVTCQARLPGVVGGEPALEEAAGAGRVRDQDLTRGETGGGEVGLVAGETGRLAFAAKAGVGGQLRQAVAYAPELSEGLIGRIGLPAGDKVEGDRHGLVTARHRATAQDRREDDREQPHNRRSRTSDVTSSRRMRTCSRLSRSRMVTVRSPSVWLSIVMQNGVPISSWRR